ncbi:UNVERIFIED_CONTAM: Retrovirus-related Pol polyprotein from transposon TNT 1-94 [Sesamum calycinum]|uniref:Retrovirus-related Pol polyprotein from transposon TNT 1-94 n=1 Tax=Sesamum calycinum TaxID=2727403 RepID=A0AAW2ITI6_9LAMI
MESCKTVTTPLVTVKKYQKEDGSQKKSMAMYRSLIGSLLYLTAQDQISFHYMSAIKVYAESEPSTLCSSKKVLRYLRGTKDFGIWNIFMGFQETSYCGTILAELHCTTSNHAIWLRRILEDIGEKQEEPTIYCDNKSAIAITKNPVQHSRTKHIDIKYHSLREATTRGEIELKDTIDSFCKIGRMTVWMVVCVIRNAPKDTSSGRPAVTEMEAVNGG